MPDYRHDLQFGVFVMPDAAHAQAVLKLSRLADELGLDLVTFQDHPYQARFLDTWTLLSVVAAQTSNVRVAPNVANLPDKSQHPVYVRTGSGDFYEGVNFRYLPYWSTTASGANIGGSPLQLARDGRMGNRLIKPDYNNLAPRLGIAWSPSEKWSVRAGFCLVAILPSFPADGMRPSSPASSKY